MHYLDNLSANTTFSCDVVIPYTKTDYPFLRDAINSILNQNFVKIVLHLVHDGTTYDPIGREYNDLSNVNVYTNTDGPTGPYTIYNRIFKYLQTDVWAIQDADDISLPNRLWKSLWLIHEKGYDIIGGAMEQFVDYRYHATYLKESVRNEPILYSGRKSLHCPSGSIVNSTLVVRKSVYEETNGMASWKSGADSEYIERCHLAGKKCFAMPDTVSLRRLRDDSLSTGELGHGTEYRKKLYQLTLDSIERQKESVDHSIGGLKQSMSDDRLVPNHFPSYL